MGVGSSLEVSMMRMGDYELKLPIYKKVIEKIGSCIYINFFNLT